MIHPLRRRDDTQETREVWLDETRRGRAWTVFYSVICSGLVSLFIGQAFEISTYNAQADRARVNCELTQRVGTLLAGISHDVAANAKDKKVEMRWEGYAQQFRSTVPPDAATCARVFPKRNYIPFVE